MIDPDITLYAGYASRAFTVRWMLAELELPHKVHTLNLRQGEQKAPAYLAINPMGKVPAITDGDVVVTENPAICLYLADRYGYGVLAPAVDSPARGPYLRWCIFATSVFEPAIYLKQPPDEIASKGRGWGDYERVIEIVDEAVSGGAWLLGSRFSTADVVLGSLLSVALFNKRFPETQAIAAYNSRICARPAYQSAAVENWPPKLFPVSDAAADG
jgi:glutathione S-transferase